MKEKESAEPSKPKEPCRTTTTNASVLAVTIGLLIIILNAILLPILVSEVSSMWEQFDVDVAEVKKLHEKVANELKSFPITREKREIVAEELKRKETFADPRSIEEQLPYKIKQRKLCPPPDESSDCPQGTRGQVGLRGEDGQPGDHGLPGTEGKQGENFQMQPAPTICAHCPAGPIGEPGNTGLSGLRGLPGQDGTPGTPGQNGYPGISGQMGDEGEQGKPGLIGEKGEPGADGVKVLKKQGAPGPRGAPGGEGPPGDQGRNNDVVSAQGYTGRRGKVGQRGRTGALGLAGPSGPEGEPGSRGECNCTVIIQSTTEGAVIDGQLGSLSEHDAEDLKRHIEKLKGNKETRRSPPTPRLIQIENDIPSERNSLDVDLLTGFGSISDIVETEKRKYREEIDERNRERKDDVELIEALKREEEQRKRALGKSNNVDVLKTTPNVVDNYASSYKIVEKLTTIPDSDLTSTMSSLFEKSISDIFPSERPMIKQLTPSGRATVWKGTSLLPLSNNVKGQSLYPKTSAKGAGSQKEGIKQRQNVEETVQSGTAKLKNSLHFSPDTPLNFTHKIGKKMKRIRRVKRKLAVSRSSMNKRTTDTFGKKLRDDPSIFSLETPFFLVRKPKETYPDHGLVRIGDAIKQGKRGEIAKEEEKSERKEEHRKDDLHKLLEEFSKDGVAGRKRLNKQIRLSPRSREVHSTSAEIYDEMINGNGIVGPSVENEIPVFLTSAIPEAEKASIDAHQKSMEHMERADNWEMVEVVPASDVTEQPMLQSSFITESDTTLKPVDNEARATKQRTKSRKSRRFRLKNALKPARRRDLTDFQSRNNQLKALAQELDRVSGQIATLEEEARNVMLRRTTTPDPINAKDNLKDIRTTVTRPRVRVMEELVPVASFTALPMMKRITVKGPPAESKEISALSSVEATSTREKIFDNIVTNRPDNLYKTNHLIKQLSYKVDGETHKNRLHENGNPVNIEKDTSRTDAAHVQHKGGQRLDADSTKKRRKHRENLNPKDVSLSEKSSLTKENNHSTIPQHNSTMHEIENPERNDTWGLETSDIIDKNLNLMEKAVDDEISRFIGEFDSTATVGSSDLHKWKSQENLESETPTPTPFQNRFYLKRISSREIENSSREGFLQSFPGVRPPSLAPARHRFTDYARPDFLTKRQKHVDEKQNDNYDYDEGKFKTRFHKRLASTDFLIPMIDENTRVERGDGDEQLLRAEGGEKHRILRRGGMKHNRPLISKPHSNRLHRKRMINHSGEIIRVPKEIYLGPQGVLRKRRLLRSKSKSNHRRTPKRNIFQDGADLISKIVKVLKTPIN